MKISKESLDKHVTVRTIYHCTMCKKLHETRERVLQCVKHHVELQDHHLRVYQFKQNWEKAVTLQEHIKLIKDLCYSIDKNAEVEKPVVLETSSPKISKIQIKVNINYNTLLDYFNANLCSTQAISTRSTYNYTKDNYCTTICINPKAKPNLNENFSKVQSRLIILEKEITNVTNKAYEIEKQVRKEASEYAKKDQIQEELTKALNERKKLQKRIDNIAEKKQSIEQNYIKETLETKQEIQLLKKLEKERDELLNSI